MKNMVVEAGMVQNRSDLRTVPCQMKLLNETHLEEMLKLKEVVVEQLAEWDMLLPLTAGMLRADLGEKGLTLGAFAGERLIGFRSVHFPGNDEDNLGRDIGLSEDQLMKVMQLEVALVHPDFRGNSLQKRMTARLLKTVRDRNLGYRYCCSWVSPKNCPSLADKFAQNLLIARVLLKCESYWRCIFFQDLMEPLHLSFQDAIPVFNRDLERLVALSNQGYWGFGLVRKGNECNILFAKCIDERRFANRLRR